MNKHLQQVIHAINGHLEKQGQSRVDPNDALFAMESDVTYDPPACWSVSRSKLIDANQSDVFDVLFDGGPSWIHGNLIISERAHPLISLAVGARVGNPHPTINVSVQRADLHVADS